MARIGILSGTRKMYLPIINYISNNHSHDEIEIFEPKDDRSTYNEQAENFLRRCSPIVCIHIEANGNLYVLAGMAISKRSSIVLLTDESMFIPIALRSVPSFLFDRKHLTSLRSFDVHATIKSSKSERDAEHNRQLPFQESSFEKRYYLPHPTGDDEVSKQKWRSEFEEYVGTILASIPGVSLRKSDYVSGSRGFDFVLWNSSSKTSLNLLANPIGVEVRTPLYFNGPQASQVIEMARAASLRSLLVFTSGIYSRSDEEKYQDRARKHGVTLIVISATELALIPDGESLLNLISNKLPGL
jgi:hypothetical protein